MPFRVASAIAVLLVAACGHSASSPEDGTREANVLDASVPSAPASSTSTRSPDIDASPAIDAGADATAPAPKSCPATTLAAGDSTATIDVGGVQRTYFVHVPSSYSGKSAVPLVFDYHPLSVSAGLWKLATGWAGVADQQGFIVVWPQGVGDSWNAGRCCGSAHDGNVDDVAFFRAMVAKLESSACIDQKRIYVSGCSNGGGMAYRLACDAADVVAAAAPVDFDCITGPTNSPSCASCNPSRPISVTQFRGTADSSVPYDGGPTSVVAGLSFPGARANFADWGTRNACTGSPQPEPTHPTCDTYPSCASGTETTLCTVPNGFHCANYLPFGIANIAWESFAHHVMP